MNHLVRQKPPEWPQKPESVIGKEVCATSGLLPPPPDAQDRCPTRFEYFIRGTEPKTVDPGKQKVWIDKTTGDLAKPGQVEDIEEQEHIVVTDPLDDRYCVDCPHPEEK
jgi:hypothetical protein